MAAILEVNDLTVDFSSQSQTMAAVRGVSFAIHPAERIGIVGESGSGKSVTSQAIMRLLPRTASIAGSIRFGDHDVLAMTPAQLTAWRGAQIGMVFQDPMSSLNPLMRVGDQITEVLRRHRGMSSREAKAEAVRLLVTVGIPDAERRLREFPHSFSGGMRQRVCIAIALACTPQLLIADEPTTALDVTIQAQVLDLLDDLADQHQTAVILISHDLGVVSSFCDRILIMYAGQIVEAGPTSEIIADPRHPYTRALLDSIPLIDAELPDRLPTIAGSPPVGQIPSDRCAFASRCPRAQDLCRSRQPELTGESATVACHYPLEKVHA